jgi:hypothetical protein
VTKFKLSKWIPSTGKTRGKTHEEMHTASKRVGHRANAYWSRHR